MDHEMDFPTIATTREFVVKSKGVGAYVEVRETDLISDVRRLLRDDLDDDQLPSPDFAFHINGVRISKKQEGHKLAFDILDQNASVELIARSDDMKEEACAKSDDALTTPSKRRRKRKNRGTTEPLANANTNENENKNENLSPRTSHDRSLDQRKEDAIMLVSTQHKILPAPKHSTGWDGRQWKLNAKSAYQQYKCKGAPGEKCEMRTRTYCSCNPSWWMCQACHLRHCLLLLGDELVPEKNGDLIS